MYDLEYPVATSVEPSFLANKGNNNHSLDHRIVETREVAYGIIAPIIVTVGMLGNILTILILKLPQFRGVTYTYFLVLAISDLLSLLLCTSSLVHLTHVGTRLYSTAAWYSYYEVPFINIPMSTSTLIIVCITIDRYFSVCRPGDFKKIHTARYARTGIALSIVIAMITWLPSGFLKEPKYYMDCNTTSFEPPDEGTWWVSCMKASTRNSTWYIVYSWVRQTIIIFIPLFILVILNSLLVKEFVRLRKKKRKLTGCEQPIESPTTKHNKWENQHLIHLLTVVTISFFITIIPSGIFGALYNDKYSTRFRFELFRALANDLEILNHALNFYLYIFCSKPIRDAATCIFRKHKQKLGDMATTNIMAFIQKTSNSTGRDDNPEPSNPAEQASIRRRGSDAVQSYRVKSKTASRETQGSELDTDNESSFNMIVPVNDLPKEQHKVNATLPSDMSYSDTWNNNAYMAYRTRNLPGENVYQKAVEKHNNKPLNCLHTVVHTAEIHNSQAPETSGLPSVTGEDENLVKENDILTENGNLVKENDIITENGNLVKENDVITENGNLQKENEILNENIIREPGNITQVFESAENDANGVLEDMGHAKEDKCVVRNLTVDKESGGHMNPAFEHEEEEEQVAQEKKGYLQNGDIFTASSLREKF